MIGLELEGLFALKLFCFLDHALQIDGLAWQKCEFFLTLNQFLVNFLKL